MKSKYNIPQILANLVGYKTEPFPGSVIKSERGSASPNKYEITTSPPEFKEWTKLGTRLYKQDFRGRWYFMPVYIKHEQLNSSSDARESNSENTLELQNAVISIKGKKNIVETALVGRKGSVKELISINDYEIDIAAFIQSEDGSYPEDEITRIRDLYNINETVELISALTELILDEGDKVVITSIDFPSTPFIEDGQTVKIKCKTDKEYKLIIT